MTPHWGLIAAWLHRRTRLHSLAQNECSLQASSVLRNSDGCMEGCPGPLCAAVMMGFTLGSSDPCACSVLTWNVTTLVFMSLYFGFSSEECVTGNHIPHYSSGFLIFFFFFQTEISVMIFWLNNKMWLLRHSL